MSGLGFDETILRKQSSKMVWTSSHQYDSVKIARESHAHCEIVEVIAESAGLEVPFPSEGVLIIKGPILW